MTVFTLLLAISKRLKLQEPDCTHFEYFLMYINLKKKKYLAGLEAEISLVEGVAILIS